MGRMHNSNKKLPQSTKIELNAFAFELSFGFIFKAKAMNHICIKSRITQKYQALA